MILGMNPQILKHRIWMKLGCYPYALPLFRIYQAYFSDGIGVVNKNTQIVIEGYPRSGNTFALAAFQVAQHRPVNIAHHVHGAAQLVRAASLGIPSILLIRNPVDAITSLLIRSPMLKIDSALAEYLRMYKSLQKYHHAYVLGTFAHVTEDFGTVVARVNAKFGTDFEIFNSSTVNLKKAFELVDKMDMSDRHNKSVTYSSVARPMRDRDEYKQEISSLLKSQAPSGMLDEAVQLFEEYTKISM